MNFEKIPSTLRVPGAYSEVNSNNAVSGTQTIRHRRLMLGSKVSAGTATVAVPVAVTRDSQAKTLFGAGSILHGMCVAALKQDPFTELVCMPLADHGSAVKAVGSFTFSGSPTVSGSVNFYIAGRKVAVAVTAGASAAAMAGLAVTAIAANTDLPVTVAIDGVNTAKVNLTAKNGGATGNNIDLRVNYYTDEELPAGVTITTVQPTGGATNPDLTTAIALLGDQWFTDWASAYTDSANIALLETELSSRFDPLRRVEGHMFTAVRGTHSAMVTLGLARNSKHHTMLQAYAEPMPVWEKAAEAASIAAYYAAIDPARPLQNLPFVHCLPAVESAQFTLPERNTLLYSGVATTKLGAGGVMMAERFITTYQFNSSGGTDTAYLDCETLFTIMYLRHDWDEYLKRKYPRHKLAGDGNRIGAGQPVMTPSLSKSEMVVKAREWEEAGLVENIADFKAKSFAERNASDANRLDNLMTPDLVNALRISGTQIQFRQ
jgi:phage tail sheath gpL-like